MTITEIANHVVENGAVLIRPRAVGEYDMKPLFTGNKRGWIMLDATTASAIKAVRDALAANPNVHKFDRIPLPKLVDFVWKHARFGA